MQGRESTKIYDDDAPSKCIDDAGTINFVYLRNSGERVMEEERENKIDTHGFMKVEGHRE